ncbi:MAG: ABC transporter permease subunit [Pseudomonadota bacterium]|nr:ABC transporter permease subunit [Pseudomonadota bacterium]
MVKGIIAFGQCFLLDKIVGRSPSNIYQNPKFRSAVIQAILVFVVFYTFYSLYQTTVFNLEERGIKTSTSFFDQVAPFKVGFSPFLNFELGETTYIEVFYIGVLNTLLVAVLGIIAATLLGFFIGILRSSNNWLAQKFALIYVEIFRNMPLLLQIMFWNFAIFLAFLPPPKQSLEFGAFYLNGRGLQTPVPIVENNFLFNVWLGIIIFSIIASFIFRNWAKKRRDQTGKSLPVLGISIPFIIIIGISSFYILGKPFAVDLPVLGKFNFKGGGQLPLPLFSLWFALTVYTSAFIAENVRAGIASVSKGQIEAARSIGLTRPQMVKLIIIPQALRVIIPPTISQYLNLTKNSSLAMAVGYEEVVAVWANISLNQTGQALIIIAMTIIFFEICSLFTSFILNIYNRRIQITER